MGVMVAMNETTTSITNNSEPWMPSPSLSPTTALSISQEEDYNGPPDSYYDNLLIFSKTQQTIIFLVAIPGALLSTLGSCLIVYAILQKKKPLQNSSQHSLLLGLCTMDILVSLGFLFVFWPWSIPEYADFQVDGASGNQQTCNFNAFLFNLIPGIQLYSASLSLYFVLVVKYQLSPQFIAKRIVPAMHIIAWGFTFSTYISGLVMKVIHPVQTTFGRCWFQRWPPNCDLVPEVECEGPEEEIKIWNLSMMCAFLLSFIVICSSMFLLYKTVRTEELKMQQYDFAYNLELQTRQGQSQSQRQQPQRRSNQRQPMPRRGSFLRRNDDNNSSRHEQDDRRTNMRISKQTAIKGLMYVSAYLATYLPIVASTISTAVMDHTVSNQIQFFIVNIIFNIFTPWQGFYHAIIFFREKQHLFEDSDGPLHFAWPVVQRLACCFVVSHTPTRPSAGSSRNFSTSRQQSASSLASLASIHSQQLHQQPARSCRDLTENLSVIHSSELNTSSALE